MAVQKHVSKIKQKIRKFEKAGKNTEGLKKELAFATGEAERKTHATGRAAKAIDERKKRRDSSKSSRPSAEERSNKAFIDAIVSTFGPDPDDKSDGHDGFIPPRGA